MKVPFFNYPKLYSSHREEYLEIIDEVLSRGAFILQKDLESFEKNLCKFTGVKYALGLANGTDAIWLALKAAGIGIDDEVIISSHTYIATPGAVVAVGAIPVPVDCKEDGMIDPSKIEEVITKKTKAILPTQLNGRCCDMEAIMRIAEKYNLLVIEDGAQGLGAKFENQSIGSFHKGSSVSFYPAKNLGSFGDAGAYLTNDKNMYEKIKLLRDHGRDDNGIFVTWGYNSRLDNVQAAILDFKLSFYANEIERRRTIAEMYKIGLEEINEIKLPPSPNEDSRYFDVYQNYEIRVKNRDEFILYLKENGVGTLIQWSNQPVHSITTLDFKKNDCPFTERYFNECVMIPMNTTLTDEEIQYVINTIKNFYNYE